MKQIISCDMSPFQSLDPRSNNPVSDNRGDKETHIKELEQSGTARLYMHSKDFDALHMQ